MRFAIRVALIVSGSFLALFLIEPGHASAGEPEFFCGIGTLIGMQCEIEGNPPHLPAGETVPVCQTGFELSGDRCVRLQTAQCTGLIVTVWIDDNADGIKQNTETLDPDASFTFYEATAAGTPGVEVTPVLERCVMSGSYIVQIDSDRLTMQGVTGGDDDSDVDPNTGQSAVIVVPVLGYGRVQAGIVPEFTPSPLAPTFLVPSFTCADGLRLDVQGGAAPYHVFFRVERPPAGGLRTWDIYPVVPVDGPGIYTSGPPFLRSYAAGVTYPLEVTVSDATGRSARPTSSFTLTEDCMPGMRPCNGLPITIDMNQPGVTGVGTSGPDVILGTPAADVIDGRGGDDTICAGDGDDQVFARDGDDWVSGEGGADTIFGHEGADTIFGGDGDDRIWGHEGPDTIKGGNGNDLIKGGNGADELFGDAGDDLITGDLGDDKIWGGDDRDRMWGFDGADELRGEDGPDTLQGMRGDDVLDGGPGRDVLLGQNDNDTLLGGAENDALAGGNGDDYLEGGAGHDRTWGQDGVDEVYGNDGNDLVNGGASGPDELYGGEGNDRIVGSPQADNAWGGPGTDRFWLGEGDDFAYGEAGQDRLFGQGGFDTCDGGFDLDLTTGCEVLIDVP